MEKPLFVAVYICAVIGLSSSSCAGTIERVPGRDALYTPDTTEQAIIDLIGARLKERGFQADYDPMISLTLYHALNDAKEKSIEDYVSILRLAGKNAIVLPYSRAKSATHFAGALDSVLGKLNDRTRFGLATLKTRDSLWLSFYATDMGISSSVPCTYLQGGGSFYPDIPAPYEISICGSISADTITYVLYRGESTLDVPADSVIEEGGTPVKDGFFRIIVTGRKGELETLTLNVYGQRRGQKGKELIVVAYAPTLITSKKRGDI